MNGGTKYSVSFQVLTLLKSIEVAPRIPLRSEKSLVFSVSWKCCFVHLCDIAKECMTDSK
jgi:hypothetical protein